MTNPGPRLTSANLKLRLASVAAVLVFAATLLVTLSTLSVTERGMKAVIGDQQFTLLSGAASFMDDRLAMRLGQVEALAAGIPPDMRADWARLKPFLTEQVRLWSADEYLNLVVFDASGEMRLSVRDLPPPATLNARGTDYFERVLETRKSVISRPIRSRLTGNHIVVFSTPVLDASGGVAAVLAGSVDLRRSG
ncbi:MAG: diguanylate cyclase, partial [Lysobacteraceae bacterium]